MTYRGHPLAWWARELGALAGVLGFGVAFPLLLAAVMP